MSPTFDQPQQRPTSSSALAAPAAVAEHSLPDGVEQFRVYPESGNVGAVAVTASAAELFGFRLAGNRTMGVYITSVIGGSLTEKEGKLEVGDQLLQCHDIKLAGMASDQVAKVIRLAFSVHGFAQLTVAKQRVRGLGHSYRPRTPFPVSRSDDELIGLAAASRRQGTFMGRAQAVSSLPNVPLPGRCNSDEQPRTSSASRGWVVAQIHNSTETTMTGLSVPSDDTEEDGRKGDMGRSLTMDIVNASEGEVNLGAEFPDEFDEGVNLPNIPTDPPSTSTSAGRNQRPGSWSGRGSQRHRTGTKKDGFVAKAATPGADSGGRPPDVAVPTGRKSSNNDKTNIIRMSHRRVVDRRASFSQDEEDMAVANTLRKKKTAATRIVQNPREVSDFISSTARKSMTTGKKQEELPLVPLDELGNQIKKHYVSTTKTRNRTRRSSRSVSADTFDENSESSGEVRVRSGSGSNELSWHCPVCLDGAKRIKSTQRRLMSTQCGHVFCSLCISDIVQEQKLCPTCRSAITSTETHPIFM